MSAGPSGCVDGSIACGTRLSAEGEAGGSEKRSRMVDKDSLGEKLRDKEKAEEDRDFARRDRELLERLRGALAEGGDAAQPAQAPIRCPGCEAALHELRRGESSVGSCPTRHGLGPG